MNPASSGILLVKLGGSLLTDKRRHEAFRVARTREVAREVARAVVSTGRHVIVGHGAGSFGHVAAADAGFGAGAKPSARAIARVQERTATLHRRVVEALAAAGLAPFSIAPSSALVFDRGRPARALFEPVDRALACGLTPVLFGDVVTDRSDGASICSTETVLLAFARRSVRRGSRVERAVFAGATQGLLDADGRTIARVDRSATRSARRAAGGAAGVDVTGGMAHRLESALALARLGIESWIVDGRRSGAIGEALEGRGGSDATCVPARR